MMRWSCHGLNGCVPVVPSRMPSSPARANRRPLASRWLARACANVSPLAERISISEEISSPATRSSSTSSARPASYSSSKRCDRASVSGSRIWNSSSIPTVKSVEASNASLALAMSSMVGSSSSGQVEVQRVEQVDGRARGVHGHVGRHLHERLGVVEDDLDACLDEVVGHALRRVGRHREHADDDVLLVDDLLQVGVGAHVELAALADGLPHLAVVGVEDRDDPEAVVGEDVRAGDRLAEVPRAEESDVVLAACAQDLADLRDERVDVVAHAALAELAEAGQVAPDLRRVDVRVVGQLLRGDRVLAHLLRLREDLEVAREARRDAEGEAHVAALAREVDAAVDRVLEAHAVTVSSRFSSSAAVRPSSNASSPLTAITGIRSP